MRLTLKICFALAAGIAANLAVCWSATVVMPQDNVEPRRLTKSPGSLLLYDQATYHRVLVMWGHGCFGPYSDFDTEGVSEFLPRWLSNRLCACTSDFESWQTLNPLKLREARLAEFVACGWPATALCGRIDHPGHPSQDYNTYTHHLILLDTTLSSLDFPKCMPLRPLMPGFAINTVFYAALCWLLFAAPFAARRAIRRRRNRCLRCNYDLRGRDPSNSRCPECGTDIGR